MVGAGQFQNESCHFTIPTEVEMSKWYAVILVLVLCSPGCSKKTEWPDSSELDQSPSIPADGIGQVTADREPEVETGFRGDVHPALKGEQLLELRAVCSPVGTGMGFKQEFFPSQFRPLFDAFSIAEALHDYSSADFSIFLPQQIGEPGQLWKLDVGRVAPFLRQFHHGASMNLEAPGRKSGPNGGYAVLRAVSETHLEIVARVHAEFVLAAGTYLTPAYFECRLLIDRKIGQVTDFALSVPTDVSLNTTLTVVLPTEALIDIIHVDKMELRGGDAKAGDEYAWTDQVSMEQARKKLKRAFYKFMEIQWVKPELAIAEAKQQNRPILAIVLWGDLDDQSC
jgi:hypothetical protein